MAAQVIQYETPHTLSDTLTETISHVWGVNEKAITLWWTAVKPEMNDLINALINLDKRAGTHIVYYLINPKPYILTNQWLLQSPRVLKASDIKALSHDVYLQHLDNLKMSDYLSRKKSSERSYYNALVLSIYRHSKTVSEHSFACCMYARKIGTTHYDKALIKLSTLALKYKDAFI
jgi:hypothetical protein